MDNTVLFYGNHYKPNGRYKPIKLIEHHYPTLLIAQRAKEREQNKKLINRDISKLSVKINNKIDEFVRLTNCNIDKMNRELGSETISYIDINSPIEIDESIITDFFTDYNEEIITITKNFCRKLTILKNKYKEIYLNSWSEKYTDTIINSTINFIHDNKPFKEILNLRYNILVNKKLELDDITKNVDSVYHEICKKNILIGVVKSEISFNIGLILDSITQTRQIPSKETKEYALLAQEFGEEFISDWGNIGNNYYTDIIFTKLYILPNNTIFSIQRFLEIHEGVLMKYQYLWTTINLEKDELLYHINKLYKSLYDIDLKAISKLKLSKFFEYQNININLDKESYTSDDLYNLFPIHNIIREYFEYQNVSFSTIYDRKYNISNYSYGNPYHAINDKIDKYSTLYKTLLEEANHIVQNNENQNRTLRNFGMIDRNEIHWVSFHNINTFINTNFIEKENMKFVLDNIISRFFYKFKEFDEFLKPIIIDKPSVFKPNDDFNQLYRNNKIIKLCNDTNDLSLMNIELVERTICELKINITRQFDNLNFERENLRDIFNSIKLNTIVPFIRLYDDQRRENIYRLFRYSFNNSSIEKIPKDILEKWINMESFSIYLTKITKNRGGEDMKCLSFKVRLCNQIDYNHEPKEFSEIQEMDCDSNTNEVELDKCQTNPVHKTPIKRYNVYYKDGTTEFDVEEYLIVDTIVLAHKPVYIDVLIYNLKGNLKIKTIFDPEYYYHPSYLSLFEERFNILLNMIQLKDNIQNLSLNKLLNNHNTHNFISLYSLSSIIELEYHPKSEIFLNYDTITETVKLLSPYLTLIETSFKVGTNILYWTSGNWIPGKIITINKDRTYNIEIIREQYKQAKKDTQLQLVATQVPQISIEHNISIRKLKLKDEKIKNYVNFRFIRISGYKKENMVEQFFNNYLNLGMSEEDIYRELQKDLNLNPVEIRDARAQFDKKQIDKVNQNLYGIDIKIFLDFYTNYKNNRTYKIEISNYTNIYDFYTIHNLLKTLFILSMNNRDARNDILKKYELSTDIANETFTNQLDIQENLDKAEEEEEDDDPYGMGVSDDEQDSPKILEDQEVQSFVLPEVAQELIDDEENDNPDVSLDVSHIDNRNSILNKLYESDRDMFLWNDISGRIVYSKYCQGKERSFRYPKSIKREQLEFIRNNEPVFFTVDASKRNIQDSIQFNKLPYSAGLGITYLGNKTFLTEHIVNATPFKIPDSYTHELFCSPDENITEKNPSCISLFYGSQVNRTLWNNIYICPRIICISPNCYLPLHPRHLLNIELPNRCNQFISSSDVSDVELKKIITRNYSGDFNKFIKDEVNLWRVCRNKIGDKICGLDIEEHNIKCPNCKKGQLSRDNKHLIPDEQSSLYIAPILGKNYIYPGFISRQNHPKNIPSICCFTQRNNPHSNLDNLFKFYEKVGKDFKLYQPSIQNETYIHSYGKQLERGRLGQLPKEFFDFFEIPVSIYTKQTTISSSDIDNRFYRYGMSLDDNNILDVVSVYILYEKYFKADKNILKRHIINNINPDIMNMTPLLEYSMTNPNYKIKFSPIQNYIEYLISDENKHDLTILQFMNRDMSWFKIRQDYIEMEEFVYKKGVFIVILSLIEGKIYIELPKGYIQPDRNDPSTKFILLLKQEIFIKNSKNEFCQEKTPYTFYEPIFKVKPKGDKNDTLDVYEKYYSAVSSSIIRKILHMLENVEQTVKSIKGISYNTIEWLYNKLGERIKKIVIDKSQYIIGALIDNNIYIPLTPSSIDFSNPLLKNQGIILHYLHIINTEEFLIDQTTLYNALVSLSKTSDFEWLEPIKRVQSIISDDLFYTGFIIGSGVIVPFKMTKLDEEISIEKIRIDYRDIENRLIKRSKLIKYSKLPYFDDISQIIHKKGFIISGGNINRLSGISYIDGIYITNISLNIQNIFIPIKRELYEPVIKNHPRNSIKNTNKLNFLNTLEVYERLTRIFDNNLKCQPISFRILDYITGSGDPRLINSIILETGLEVSVSLSHGSTRITDIGPSGNYEILQIRDFDNDIYIESLTNTEYQKDKVSLPNGENRVIYMEQMDKSKESYNRFRYEISQILHIREKFYKQNIIEYLRKYGDYLIKKKQIEPIIINLIKKYFVLKSHNENDIEIEQGSCFNISKNTICDKNKYCIWDNKFEHGITTMDEYVDREFPKAIQKYNIKKGKNLNKYKNIKEFILNNGGIVNEEKTQEAFEHNIRNYLQNKYAYIGNCKFIFEIGSENPEYIGKLSFVLKFLDELIRNITKRDEILNNKIKFVNNRISYNYYNGEMFFTNNEIKLGFYDTVYCKTLRSRLKVQYFWTTMTNDIIIEIPQKEIISVMTQDEPVIMNVVSSPAIDPAILFQKDKKLDFTRQMYSFRVIDDLESLNLRPLHFTAKASPGKIIVDKQRYMYAFRVLDE
jgi:hypothetical protein